MTGEVAAAKLLDRMKAIEGQVISLRAPQSYANSWSREDIKIDIPETGVSLLELDRLLREKLGHDTPLSGEIVRSDTGLVLSARAGAESTEDISGTASEMDSLIQRLAEAVYRVTQPYRYAAYLARQGKIAESDAIMKKIVEGGESKDRPWALLRLTASLRETTGLDKTLAALRRAVANDPNNSIAVLNIAELQVYLSHPEAAIAGYKQDLLLLRGPNVMEMRPESISGQLVMAQADIDAQLGAFRDAAQAFSQAQSFPVTGRFETAPQLARMFADDHDAGGALEAMGLKFRDVPGYDGTRLGSFVWSRMEIAAEKSDWAGVLREAREMDSLLPQYPGLRSSVPTVMVPLVAFADAMLGDYASAEAAISRTPADCYRCLIVRARIAARHGSDSRADWWFDRAVKAAPSIPFAYADWGQALLMRGKPDDAIAQFKLANRRGPHFADPLEGWGEALMAKNQSHLALAKFMEADKYAPNWGRLHLKWGEALVYAGKRDEARAQFARAAQLDLTTADKAELAKASSHG
jgi:tetratricopeptide (TPR) repeat protein